MKYLDFVREATPSREELDRFLDSNASNWARFDPELGYVLSNSLPRDGINGSRTISTVQEDGARHSSAYRHRPRRINTYGDSYTQCHQVSDQETWQEYLAGHLGEPVGNFGMGGYGLYQAYRRLRRVESTPQGAPYVILYAWDDDHRRSLLHCRFVLFHKWLRQNRAGMFHSNPWAHLSLDLDSGSIVECENPLPTPQSLYRLTDPDYLVELCRTDYMMQMSAFLANEIEDPDVAMLSRISEALRRGPLEQNGDLRKQIDDLHNAYGFAATFFTLGLTLDFLAKQQKQLLVVLYAPSAVPTLIESGHRYDQPVVDWLEKHRHHYFDMTTIHVEDYKAFNVPVKQYMARFGGGHYAPAGNHFFAYAIKDTIVNWLDPKPLPYRDDDAARISFEQGYLTR